MSAGVASCLTAQFVTPLAASPLPQVLKLADWVWAQFYQGSALKPAERGRLASKLLRHHSQVYMRMIDIMHWSRCRMLIAC